MDSAHIPKEERTWSLFTHLSPLLSYLGIPFANIIAPLIIWQMKKEDMPFVAANAKECLNFQISVTIYAIVCVLLIFAFVGIPLLLILGIVAFVLAIVAAIKANDGQAYHYPITIRFLK